MGDIMSAEAKVSSAKDAGMRRLMSITLYGKKIQGTTDLFHCRHVMQRKAHMYLKIHACIVFMIQFQSTSIIVCCTAIYG